MQPITIAKNGRNSSRRPRGTSAGGSVTLPGLPLLVPIALLLLAISGVFTPLPVEAGPLGSSEDFSSDSGSRHVLGHPISKRSFFDIQCKGFYDKSIFARLDRICEDCYNLFREPQLHSLCRSQCFSSPYFKGCLEALLLSEEEDKYNQMVDFLGK